MEKPLVLPTIDRLAIIFYHSWYFHFHVLSSRFLVQQKEKCLFYLSVLANSASQQCTHKFSRLSIGSIHALWSRFLVQQKEKSLFYLSVLANSVPEQCRILIYHCLSDSSSICRPTAL